MNANYHLKPQVLTMFDHSSASYNSSPVQIERNNVEKQQFIIQSKIPMINILYKNNSLEPIKNVYMVDSSNENVNCLNNFNGDEPISSSSSSLQSSQRKKFSQEEDIQLKRLIAINGPKKWDQIALSMPGRTGRQCRDRFHNYLNPGLINGPWTRDEDIILEQKVFELGQHWNKIAKFFNGRSTNNIKNRWYTYVCKQKKDINRSILVHDKNRNYQNLGYHLPNNNDHYICSFIGKKDKTNLLHNKSEMDCNCNSNGLIVPINELCGDHIQKESSKESESDNRSISLLGTKKKSDKKIFFPPISPPDGNFFLPSNQGIFNFLTFK